MHLLFSVKLYQDYISNFRTYWLFVNTTEKT